MPAYNEAGCIEKVVLSWLAQGKKLFASNFRLIVVNDGSRDNTGDILNKLQATEPNLTVVHQENQGHGAALLHAYRKSLEFSPKYVFHVDSDDQFITDDFSKLWARRSESRFILGHRIQRQDAFHRLVITQILRSVLFVVFGTWILDSNIPFRLIEGNTLKAYLAALPQDIFAPNIFLAVMAAKNGERLLNIPIHHESRKTGTVSIMRLKLLKVCIRSVKELILFRMNLSKEGHAACVKKEV